MDGRDAGRAGVWPCTVFAKPLPHSWILRKFAYADIHHPDDAALVWAGKGVLYRAPENPAGPASAKVLYDFNSMRLAARTAPY